MSDDAELSHQPRILSLDGGGVRGLSSLVILDEIMKDIKRREHLEQVPLPCTYFDLIGGTSTGGLIAIMLGRLRMSVEECIEKYMKLSEEVFNCDHAVFGVLPTGEKGVRFDASILEGIVKSLVKEKLGDEDAVIAETITDHKPCATFVVTTSAAMAQGPPILFRSYNNEQNDADNCPIWKTARATSAAPSFFEPMFIDVPVPGAWHVDGGLRYNNPSQLALQEAQDIWPRVKRFTVLSIGTGRQSNVEFVNIKDVQPPKETSTSVIGRIVSRIPGSGVVHQPTSLAPFS